ncbi:MAG: hypothetical protein KKC85_04895 [Gammaproteobacteria bacterium]|nr:hypothetical protein [Gammaproteobacteria bacterium]MBU2285754.1 hypothetical protein [Gammaproteobacteria bacterium]
MKTSSETIERDLPIHTRYRCCRFGSPFMPASPAEFAVLTATFDKAHSRPARALAELFLAGNSILESHDLLEGPIGDAFEKFVMVCAIGQGVSITAFKAAVKGLKELRATLDELDQLPE